MTVPVEPNPRLSRFLGVELYVKRDDLFPMTGGGNKARKVKEILDEAEASGYNALITTGGVQSNHARAVALMAAAKGWPCRLVLHGKPESLKEPRGNLLLMLLARASIDIVEPSDIARGIDRAVAELTGQGYRPLVIPGGGSLRGALAYVKAAEEAVDQFRALAWFPEWVLLASGTGSTQAGLLVGFRRAGYIPHVLGISIARRNPRGKASVERWCSEVLAYLGEPAQSVDVVFRDEWVGEGYAVPDERTWEVIQLAASVGGLVLDPTYTGKAFAALIDLVHEGEIPQGSRVLFWHTGGLLNLMAERADFLSRR